MGDPKDDASTPVWQLETAMGAAIECFAGAQAVEVPRTRFAPVKKCSDLFLLRSDAYVIEDFKPALAKGVDAAPTIDLDSKKFKMVPQLDKCTPNGVPSLKQCKKLTVKGEVVFSAGTTFIGGHAAQGDVQGHHDRAAGLEQSSQPRTLR